MRRAYGRTGCLIDGCDRRHHGKGYCRVHLHRMKHHGTPDRLIIRQSGCDVKGCERKHYSRGFCEVHYQRHRAYGRTELLSELRTESDRFWSKVAQQEGGDCWLWIGGLTMNRHGVFANSPAYRYSYQQMIGEIPEGLELDHLCNNPRCVNPYHLDPVTGEENRRRYRVSQRAKQ